MVEFSFVWKSLVWYGRFLFGLEDKQNENTIVENWLSLVEYGLVWFRLVWLKLVWLSMVLLKLVWLSLDSYMFVYGVHIMDHGRKKELLLD